MKILYVEDDPRDADLTRRELAKTAPQIELDIVASVREALARLEDDVERYDLALIDLKLSNGDGMDLLRTIRERGLPLAVVIITGRGDEEVAVAALKAGADDYVVKRKDYLTRLPLTLEDALDRSQARTERHARSLCVLYAEHSATDVDLTQRHLARHTPHIQFDVVHTAADVLQGLSRTPEAWDVLLLDYNLPGTNALEVLKEVRQRRGLDVPIVLVTGRGDEDVAVQALRLGAADYLVKSAGYLYKLPSVLENAFRRAQLARKQAALRESERQYRNIFDGIQDAIFVESLSGEILDVNDRACDMFGYSRDEFLTKTVDDLVPPGKFALIPDELTRDEMPSQPIETINIRADGKRFPVEITGQLQDVGDDTVLLVVARDITERKQAERALRQYAERMRTLHAIDGAILAAWSPEETAQAALRHLRQLVPCMVTAVATFDLEAQEATLFAVDADREVGLETGMHLSLKEVIDVKALQQGKILVEEELQAVAQPSAVTQALQTAGVCCYIATPLIAQGKLIGALGLGAESPAAFALDHVDIVREVADQVAVALHQARLSAALETERRRLETTVEHTPEGIVLLDAQRRILLANPTAKEHLPILTNARPGDVLARLADRPLEELLAPPPKGLWHELEIPGPPHRIFEVLTRPVAENRHHSEGWVLTVRDVTEERKAQKHIQRQERLAAVGQLAGGIAHDFRNFLSSILLYADMASRNPDLPPDLTPAMETIISESHQASRLVQQILDFSRRSMMKTQPLDLKPFVKEAIRVLEPALPDSISMLHEAEPGEYVVEADPTRIQQVLINLALNARDAMPEGGDLHIDLFRIPLAPGEKPPVAEMAPGEWVCLAVSDTGSGMTEEVQAHLFEPFFTTKERGTGAGLGLAQVHGIVEQHEGHIDVETEVGVGSTFRVYLPAHGEEDVGQVETRAEEIPQGKGERILLVEDEDSVRQAIEESLTSLGYRLLTAANGQEALEVYQAVQPDLVIVDLVMPEMGGRALMRALREQDPELKALMMTGYAVDSGLEALEENGIAGVVKKPFEVHRLAQAVRRVLEA